MESEVRRKFVVRYVKAYISVAAVAGAVLVISELSGAGWRPVLAGAPLYVALLALVTYAMVRELIILKKK
ncbi:hypothetical protein KDW19_08040 [Burkholderia cenocepacia]|uniref:hypothetical protein n=1 Tax=Burkholderia cepacia complex TaxID=87882 RepID=UPI00196A8543|nr:MULTISPECIES: hypothetical protein [Burkholderia cepacia complex]ELW9447741.1 hypothetical protein [Burkholderia cenocepacia]MBN3566598.1 hypothetical protein [Burkholderia cenocepacia]MBR8110061.1 hypothetical protein [Burkholderia cenocepacia]MBR8318003.1 hypothetical protein [Burkholderia cenocepacia]MBR8482401.1 hypothetical protein [Burkholderia cenocepacia]